MVVVESGRGGGVREAHRPKRERKKMKMSVKLQNKNFNNDL